MSPRYLIRETIEYIVAANDEDDARLVMADVGAEVASSDDRVVDSLTDHQFEVQPLEDEDTPEADALATHEVRKQGKP